MALWSLASCLAWPMTIGAAGNEMLDNMTLPSGGIFISGSGSILANALSDAQKNGVMDVKQNESHAIIGWDDFSIGANAQVNFSKNGGGEFSVLNYVTGGHTSQIYGKMNASTEGHIYLVNPNGVQIGNSAEINVGSLYVSNRQLTDGQLTALGNDFSHLKETGTVTGAELMSLGYIDAKKVSFDGDRIVIDVDRLNQKTQGDFDLEIQRAGASDADFNLVMGSSQTDLGGLNLLSMEPKQHRRPIFTLGFTMAQNCRT